MPNNIFANFYNFQFTQRCRLFVSLETLSSSWST